MSSSPPAKKAKSGTPVGNGSVTDANASLSLPDLSFELIGRIATFLDLGDETMNVCVAVGPTSAAVVRHTFLRDNNGYVMFTVGRYVASFFQGKAKCKQNLLAWMEVNSHWKERCTPDNMKEFAEVASLEDGKATMVVHPNVVFNNPAVAAELGLVEVLNFLVEEKGVGVNEYKWTSYYSPHHRHLLACAMLAEDSQCFDYLLSRKEIDLKSLADDNENDGARILHTAMTKDSAPSNYWLEVIAGHPSVDVNAIVICQELEVTPLHYLLGFQGKLDTWLEKMEILLAAGANPYLGTDDVYSPMECVDDKTDTDVEYKKAYDMLREWGQKNSAA